MDPSNISFLSFGAFFSTSMGESGSRSLWIRHQPWSRAVGVVKSQGSDQAMKPSNMLEEGPAASKETPSFFHANFALPDRFKQMQPWTKEVCDQKTSSKQRRQVPQGFHGRKQPKLWQFHSNAWGLLPQKSVCPCLTLVFAGLRPN